MSAEAQPRLPIMAFALLAAGACTTASDSTTMDAGPTQAPADAGTVADAGSTTGPVRRDVSFTAADMVRLTGRLTTPGTGTGQPGVVLLHQYGSDMDQWGDLENTLATAGYRVLAFNLRGHGTSDAYTGGALSNLLTDPEGAPRDVTAALELLGTQLGADATRLAVVGTSVGANLAVGAAIRGQVRTAAAFSARKPPTEALAGAPAAGMTRVFYMAGELDPGGQAADAQTMFDATAEPRALHVLPQTADHGVDILRNHAEATTLLLDWLQQNL